LDLITIKSSEQHIIANKKIERLEIIVSELKSTNSILVETININKGISYLIQSYILKPIFSVIQKEVWVAMLYIVAGLSVTVYLTYVFQNTLFVKMFGAFISFASETVMSFFGKQSVISLPMIANQISTLNLKLELLNVELNTLISQLLNELKVILEFSLNKIQELVINTTNSSNQITVAGFNSILEDATLKDKLVKECLVNLHKQNIKLTDDVINIVVQSVSKTIEKDLSNTAAFVLKQLELKNLNFIGNGPSLVSDVMLTFSEKNFAPSEQIVQSPTAFVNHLIDDLFE